MSDRTESYETRERGGKKRTNEDATESEIEMAQNLLRRHQSSSKDVKINCGSSDSDSAAARFRTPLSRKRKSRQFISPPKAPQKRKVSSRDRGFSDSDDEDVGHKRSKVLLKKYDVKHASTVKKEHSDEDIGRDDNDLKKQIVSLKKKIKGNLKAQTVKISMDLDKKNKELMAKNEELKKEIKEKTMSGNEGLEEQVKRMRKDRDFFRNKFEKEVSHLDRVRKERNRAEDKLDVVKKEVSTLIETTKKIEEI